MSNPVTLSFAAPLLNYGIVPAAIQSASYGEEGYIYLKLELNGESGIEYVLTPTDEFGIAPFLREHLAACIGAGLIAIQPYTP